MSSEATRQASARTCGKG